MHTKADVISTYNTDLNKDTVTNICKANVLSRRVH